MIAYIKTRQKILFQRLVLLKIKLDESDSLKKYIRIRSEVFTVLRLSTHCVDNLEAVYFLLFYEIAK